MHGLDKIKSAISFYIMHDFPNRRHTLMGALAASFMGSAASAQTTPLSARFDAISARLPNYPRFQTLGETRARIRARAQAHPDKVSITPIGRSRSGDPIELITIAGGPRNALMVAGVHANEPVGVLAADFLMGQMLVDPELNAALGYSWHFINPIDPDGLRLNEPWFTGPLDPLPYFRDFFRPPLDRQAEYTFPLEVGAVSFNHPTPGNDAWRAALERVKPDFQYSTHNAEYGGAFFLVSRHDPALEAALVKVPSRFGVGINTVGEAFSDLVAEFASGVFQLPMPKALLDGLIKHGNPNPAAAWPVGGSSTEYAAERWGTVSFTAEVPYWDDPRVFDQSLSPIPLTQVVAGYVADTEESAAILNRWRDRVPSETQDRSELAYALRQDVARGIAQVAGAKALAASGAAAARGPVSVSQIAQTEVFLQLNAARPHALLARSARTPGSPIPAEAAAECQAFIERQVAKAQSNGAFRRVPLRDVVGVQVLSGLLAAQAAKPR
jgi:hypothetical protein